MLDPVRVRDGSHLSEFKHFQFLVRKKHSFGKNFTSCSQVDKLFALPKFGSPQGHTSASLNIGEILAICKTLASL